MKFKKTILSTSVVLALTCYETANAQWAVLNVGDIINRIYTQAGFDGVAGKIAELTSTTQQQVVQNANNVAATDVRARVGNAQYDVFQRVGPNAGPQPNLADCVAATKKQQASAGVKAAGGGGGGGPNSPTREINGPADKTDADKPAQIINAKKDLDTCTVNDNGLNGCSGQNGAYAAGDFHPRGMDGDMSGIIIDQPGPYLNSYTISKKGKGWAVAQQNIKNQTLYGAPKGLDPSQLSKNQAYVALSTPLNAKLYAAEEALMFSARMKQESEAAPSGVAGDFWNSGSDYAKITGLKGPAPKNPSLYDTVNYSVMNAYTGDPSGSLDEAELNRRLALSNFILWKSYQQQEQTNRLLANILVQLVTPVNPTQVDNSHQKAISSVQSTGK